MSEYSASVSDFQALSVFLPAETFMLAVIALIAPLGAPDRPMTAKLDISPVTLACVVAGDITLTASGAVTAWIGIFASAVHWRNTGTGACGAVSGVVSGIYVTATPLRRWDRQVVTGTGNIRCWVSTDRPHLAQPPVTIRAS